MRTTVNVYGHLDIDDLRQTMTNLPVLSLPEAATPIVEVEVTEATGTSEPPQSATDFYPTPIHEAARLEPARKTQ